MPATVFWDGGGTINNWSDQANWRGDVGPVSGDDLVFPPGAARLTNFNNLPSDTVFNSITFSGAGYIISGGSGNVVVLGRGGIVNSATSGTNHYDGPIRLGRAVGLNVAVASGGTLQLGGALSGLGGLVKTGAGTLQLMGADPNTYTGLTDVRGGLLRLNKGATGQTAVAVPGNLQILSSTAGNTIVQEFRDDQIADSATVTITRTTNSRAALLLITNSDAIGALNLTGGEVDSPLGRLTLNGDVTAQAAQLGTTFATAKINLTELRLGSGTRMFTVNAQLGSLTDLSVQGSVSGGTGLIKQGAGVMELGGIVAIGGPVEVNGGTLTVDDEVDNPVILRNDGRLAGSGSVFDVETLGGGVGTQDNSDAGFTATAGWNRSTGQGFGNDLIQTMPSTVSGSVQTATWSFNAATPGFYRVFTTWTGGAGHSTRAPYSIFADGSLRDTVFVDQEKAPINGPKDGGVVFQQIGGAFLVTGGSLRVSVSNTVDAEPGGANVVADAVRIERLAGTVDPGGGGSPKLLHLTEGTLGTGSTYRVHLQEVSPGVDATDQISSAFTFECLDTLLEIAATSFSPPDPGTAFHIITQTVRPGMRFSNLPNDGDTIELVVGDQRHTFSIAYDSRLVGATDLVYLNTATQVRDLTLSPDVIDEGGRVTLRGALTDPNPGDVLTLRVDWGDGTVESFADLGTAPFRFTHTYADNSPDGAPYPVRVSWSDQHGAGNDAELFVTVNNVPPRLVLGGAEVARAGAVVQHTARFTDPGADTFTATVDYGDGSGPQPLVVQPGQRLLLDHRYTKPAKYRVTVTVLDDDGGLSTDSLLVIVLPAL